MSSLGAVIIKKSNTAQLKKRYDQERWLQAALDILAKDGGAKLRVSALAASLNVTKGSFYHHFSNRSEFVAKVTEYWASKFTAIVIDEIGELPCHGKDKLREVMRLVAQKDLDKYDMAFRSWAAQDTLVANEVKKVDQNRQRFIRTIFEEMGFTGVDLETRLRAWLVYASSNRSVSFQSTQESEEPTPDDFLEFFTS
ncbi:TetR/AcrR family transcriptional regulator [Falsihalocynthiibacter sp. S25ZX9]|uniref:TetR/AcrR family transcriptional regulator n=1 Tax=Falsihalocynthiibacter sp. S25ZX9 TaxID=3240870 RepID=UPI00350F92B2